MFDSLARGHCNCWQKFKNGYVNQNAPLSSIIKLAIVFTHLLCSLCHLFFMTCQPSQYKLFAVYVKPVQGS